MAGEPMVRVGDPNVTPVPVVTVKVVALAMLAMVSPAGRVVPVTLWATYRPVVLATVTVAEPRVVEPGNPVIVPEDGFSAAPMVSGALVAVSTALAERTKTVPLVILAIVAPNGMPKPLTLWPGARPAVLATVTLALPAVRAEPTVNLTGCKPS